MKNVICTTGSFLRRLPRYIVIGLLRVYQWGISPMTGLSCRYYPSCSRYALTAVERFGVLRGGWLTVKRLARCHPWTPGGVDHVPTHLPTASSTPLVGASSPERTR